MKPFLALVCLSAAGCSKPVAPVAIEPNDTGNDASLGAEDSDAFIAASDANVNDDDVSLTDEAEPFELPQVDISLGNCIGQCRTDSDCGRGLRCVDDYDPGGAASEWTRRFRCYPTNALPTASQDTNLTDARRAEGECLDDADCRRSQVCEHRSQLAIRKCVATCNADGDCPEWKGSSNQADWHPGYCIGGECSQCRPAILGEEGCPPEQTCFDFQHYLSSPLGGCRGACESDDDCRTQGLLCAKPD